MLQISRKAVSLQRSHTWEDFGIRFEEVEFEAQFEKGERFHSLAHLYIYLPLTLNAMVTVD